MVWHSDLAPLDGPGEGASSALRAVGWLEGSRPFPTGPVERAVYERLLDLLRDLWQPAISMGFHRCDLCLYEGPTGKRDLYVPGDGVVFVCPELIAHYMNAHGYAPPGEFCRAVLACPPMLSMDYLKSSLANGGRPLVKSNHG